MSEYSPRLHKLETRNAREWDDDDESDAISQQLSEGQPDLDSSTDEDDEELLACEEFIRESAELFESEEDKKSRQRLLEFAQGELIERLIALEKPTKVSDFPKRRPGSVKQFMCNIDSEKSAKDLLQDTSGSRKRKYLSAVSPRQPKINETPQAQILKWKVLPRTQPDLRASEAPLLGYGLSGTIIKSIRKQRSRSFWRKMPLS